MVDTLVAFGCSNTYGNEALESGKTTPDNIYHAYPYFLSQMLNIPNYKNYALSGSSNVAIGMKVADFIFKNPDLHSRVFIVIGWSGDNRLSITNPSGTESSIRLNNVKDTSVISGNMKREKPEQIFDCLDKLHHNVFFNSNFTKKLLFSHYIEKHGNHEKNFLQHMLRDLLSIFVFNTESFIFLNAIARYGTIQLLQNHNIKYFTLPTILHYPHPLYKLISKKNNILCYDDKDNIVFEPEAMFQAYKHKDAGHTSNVGHMKIAEFLYDYIKKNDTIPL